MCGCGERAADRAGVYGEAKAQGFEGGFFGAPERGRDRRLRACWHLLDVGLFCVVEVVFDEGRWAWQDSFDVGSDRDTGCVAECAECAIVAMADRETEFAEIAGGCLGFVGEGMPRMMGDQSWCAVGVAQDADAIEREGVVGVLLDVCAKQVFGGPTPQQPIASAFVVAQRRKVCLFGFAEKARRHLGMGKVGVIGDRLYEPVDHRCCDARCADNLRIVHS